MIEFLQSNQFAQGGLLLAGAAAAWRYCSGVVSFARTQVERRAIVSLEINSDDPMWPALSKWVAAQPWSSKGATYGVGGNQTSGSSSGAQAPVTSGTGVNFGNNAAERPQIPMNPLDACFGRWRDRFIIWNCWRYRRDGGGNAFVWNASITILPGRFEQVSQLMEEIVAFSKEETPTGTRIRTAKRDYWGDSKYVAKRPIESVVSPSCDEIVADFQSFLSREEHYVKTGIPFRRGYLLSGPPGTGKSSLALALAGIFDSPLYYLSINPSNASHLEDLINQVERAILLIEDIDCAGITVSREKSEGAGSLAGLLNAVDGAGSSHGRVIIFTTNRPEVLDPALIRPGRIDRHFVMGHATRRDIETRVAQVLEPAQAAKFLAEYQPDKPVTMAEVQAELFKYLA